MTSSLPHDLIAAGRARLITSAHDVIDALANHVNTVNSAKTMAAEGTSS